jgi:hypothetical protein
MSRKYKKVNFILASGSNEFMFKDTRNSLQTVKNTQIETAKADSESGIKNAFFGTSKNIFLPNLTQVEIGRNNQGVFSNELTHNLGSVRRICENNMWILFSNEGYHILEPNEAMLQNAQILHSQARDKKTGLYPLTMLVKKTKPQRESESSHEKEPVFVTQLNARQGYSENSNQQQNQRLGTQTHTGGRPGKPGYVARVYTDKDLSDFQKWHRRLGHFGGKKIKKCNIPGLRVPRSPQKCESCVLGKIHKLGNTGKPESERVNPTYSPGEYIITDLQGPYTRSRGGARYNQIFLDLGSKFIWTFRLKTKPEALQKIERVLQECIP